MRSFSSGMSQASSTLASRWFSPAHRYPLPDRRGFAFSSRLSMSSLLCLLASA